MNRKYCPYYLVEYCPHDLFVNTKSDIGPCDKVHDENAKRAFEQLSEEDQWRKGLPKDMLRYCERLVDDIDQKIRRQERKVAAEPDVGANLDQAGRAAQQEQLDAIESKITALVDQMDALAEAVKIFF
jgi:hypothetical protein